MNVHDLTREQLHELKDRYMVELADEGTFAEVIGRDYNAPSWEDMADADEIVPDDVIFRQWEDVDFTNEDFFCSAGKLETGEKIYQPVMKGDEPNVPKEMWGHQVFSSRETAAVFMNNNGYDPGEYEIIEYEQEDIEDYVLIF